MRARTVPKAEAATSALAWQPLLAQLAQVRVVEVYAQVLSPVGMPWGSRHGMGRNRCPVAWDRKPPCGSVIVRRLTWHPAHSLGFASVACELKILPSAYTKPAGR